MQKLYLFSRPKAKLLRNRNFPADLLIWRSDFELLQFRFHNKNSVHSFFKWCLVTWTLDFPCLQWKSSTNKETRIFFHFYLFLRPCCRGCRLSNTRAPWPCAYQNVRLCMMSLWWKSGEISLRAWEVIMIFQSVRSSRRN